MRNEEDYIRNKVGKENPYRVPQGYFENFTSQMMDRLPDCDARDVLLVSSRKRRIRLLWYAAATTCVAIFSLTAYFANIDDHKDMISDDVMAVSHANVSSITYEDEVLDYAMLDNTDIYTYLSGE